MVDNDQINDRCVCLIIKGGKLTAQYLAKSMKLFLDANKIVVKNPITSGSYAGKGKQTVKQLVGQGHGVTSIEISDKNIKSFETIARKYGVDFAVIKDAAEYPQKHLVFFKARDTDAISAAFKEYSAKQMAKSTENPSLTGMLRGLMEKVKSQVLDQTKHKQRGQEL